MLELAHVNQPRRTPVVSVIIPTYNREATLDRALQSVFAQDFENFECIIIDNCSTDSTWDLVKDACQTDRRFLGFRQGNNVGPAQNWRTGANLAQADLIKFCFSDDWLSPNCLSSGINLMSRADASFVYYNYMIEGSTGAVTLPPSLPNKTFLFHSFVSYAGMPVTPTAGLFRTTDVQRVLNRRLPAKGVLDFEATGAGYDQAIFLEASLKRKTAWCPQDACVYFGVQHDSITVESNRERPGQLLRTYHEAQLMFLKQHVEHLTRAQRAMYAIGVRYHMIRASLNASLMTSIRRGRRRAGKNV